jgi:hypothetical protein
VEKISHKKSPETAQRFAIKSLAGRLDSYRSSHQQPPAATRGRTTATITTTITREQQPDEAATDPSGDYAGAKVLSFWK